MSGCQLYCVLQNKWLQGLRFGAKPDALEQALHLGFDLQEERLSISAQQQAKLVRQQAVQALQKVPQAAHVLYESPHVLPTMLHT